jgi:mono/diheme cytochrome c family protein
MPHPTHPRPSLRLALVLGVAAAAGLCACADRHSGAGLRLPDGDAERGRQVFLDQKCHTCHRVEGVDLPAPSASPPVPVVLGGPVPHVKTDGDLVTSILNPSHSLPGAYRPEEVKAGEASRMPDYGDTLSARQLVDVIAFLQSRYRVVRPGGGP